MPAVIPVVAAVAGGAIAARGARGAAETQAGATNEATSEQRRQFNLQREDSLPYRETGRRALTSLEGEIDSPITAAEVMDDPGYQFGLSEGQRAMDRKVAASGGRVSGAALRAATRYGTDYGSAGYGAAYQRRQDRLNRLAALAGIGQTATANSAAAGQASANAISSAVMSQGDAAGAARMAQGNIWADTGNQIAALYGRRSRGGGTDTSSFRANDPYRSAGYYGGDEGE